MLVLPLALSACVTPRLYSEQELSSVGRLCGIAEGEVVQEPEEPRLLFLFTIEPSETQLDCIQRWSRKRNLHLARIEGVEWIE